MDKEQRCYSLALASPLGPMLRYPCILQPLKFGVPFSPENSRNMKKCSSCIESHHLTIVTRFLVPRGDTEELV